MKNQSKPASSTNKKFVQVSLAPEFAAEVRSQADSSDRSMAAQLEHWSKLARAIETVFPAAALSELKAGNPSEVLSRVGAYLISQNPASLRAKLANASSPLYGVDEADPAVVIRYNPDGSKTRGAFDVGGNFVPSAADSAKKEKHAARQTQKPASKTVTGNRPRRTGASKDRSRDAVPA